MPQVQSLNAKSVNKEELILYWRDNPVEAANDIWGAFDPDWYLPPHQRLVLNSRWKHSTQYDILSRGTGKTFINAVTASLECILYPGHRVGLIAPSFRQCLASGASPLCFFTNDGVKISVDDFYANIVPGQTTIQSEVNANLINGKWVNPPRPGLVVGCEKGFRFTAVSGHTVLSVRPNNAIEYVSIDDLCEGDWLVIRRGPYLHAGKTSTPFTPSLKHWAEKSVHFPTTMNDDLAYFIGVLIGDGNLTWNPAGGKYAATLTSMDQCIASEFTKIALEQFGLEVSIEGDRKAKQYVIYSKGLVSYLLSLGMTTNYAPAKFTPAAILRSSTSHVKSYLSGLFDTDGGNHLQTEVENRPTRNFVVGYSTASERLAYETRELMLSVGVVAGVNFYTNTHAGEYKVRLCNSAEVKRFADQIGYRCIRKIKALQEFVEVKPSRSLNADLIPYSAHPAMIIADVIKRIEGRGGINTKLVTYLKIKGKKSLHLGREKVLTLLNAAAALNIVTKETKALSSFANSNLVAVQVQKLTPTHVNSVDIEVANENCYVAGGFIHHNSKMIFAEVKNLHSKSPLFQEACDGPKATPESCYIDFRAAPGRNPSRLEALPLGSDGAKIRGARFYTVIADEAAQIDNDILNTVVRGFLATSASPGARAKFMMEQRRKIAAGEMTEADLVKPKENKFIASSTAFYQYNHLWSRVQGVVDEVQQELKSYQIKNQVSVEEALVALPNLQLLGGPLNEGQIPHRILSNGRKCVTAFTYKDAPEGFMNESSIEQSRSEMSDYVFRMEYEAFFPPDSQGFFRRSTLDACRRHHNFVSILHPRKGMEYVMGIDPARSHDNFAIAIFEVDNHNRKINLVRVMAWNKKDFVEMHANVRKLVSHYGIKYFQMDAGGGGTTVRDLLANQALCPVGDKLILERDFDEHRILVGERLLGPLCQFSDTMWLHDANFNLLSGIQHGMLQIASNPADCTQILWTNELEEANDEIEGALMEMSSIVVTSAGSRMHWDTPTKGQRKDRYSAILIGYDAALKVLGNTTGNVTLAMGFWG